MICPKCFTAYNKESCPRCSPAPKAHVFTLHVPDEPPADWYDGKPKVCPGTGQVALARFSGEVHADGERVYLCRCLWCDRPMTPAVAMPEHTFIPVDPEQLTFITTGKVLEGIEWQSDKACDGDHPIPRCHDPQCYHRDPRAGNASAPHIVVLCGSCKFYDQFQRANYEETLKGHIVLSVGFAPDGMVPQRRPPRTGYRDYTSGQWHPAPSAIDYPEHARGCATCQRTDGSASRHAEDVGCTQAQKLALDELHKKKIDLADEVFVLNVGGYIGTSTASEIAYAEENGKPIRWLEPPVDLCGYCHHPIGELPALRVTSAAYSDVGFWHQHCFEAWTRVRDGMKKEQP